MAETRREFIIKRVFRIWPTLALAIVLTWIAKTVAASFGAAPFAGFSTASTAWHYVESLFFLDWMSAGGLPSKEDTSKNLVVTGGWGWFGSAEARSVA